MGNPVTVNLSELDTGGALSVPLEELELSKPKPKSPPTSFASVYGQPTAPARAENPFGIPTAPTPTQPSLLEAARRATQPQINLAPPEHPQPQSDYWTQEYAARERDVQKINQAQQSSQDREAQSRERQAEIAKQPVETRLLQSMVEPGTAIGTVLAQQTPKDAAPQYESDYFNHRAKEAATQGKSVWDAFPHSITEALVRSSNPNMRPEEARQIAEPFTQPLLDLPTATGHTAQPIVAGAERAIGGFTSPENIALLGALGELDAAAQSSTGLLRHAPRVVSGLFTTQMGAGLIQSTRDYQAAKAAGDTQTAQRILGSALVQAPLTLLTTYHATAGRAGAPMRAEDLVEQVHAADTAARMSEAGSAATPARETPRATRVAPETVSAPLEELKPVRTARDTGARSNSPSLFPELDQQTRASEQADQFSNSADVLRRTVSNEALPQSVRDAANAELERLATPRAEGAGPARTSEYTPPELRTIEKVEALPNQRQQAQAYVNRIRSLYSREYAQSYLKANLEGGLEPERGNLSPLEAAALRRNVEDNLAKQPRIPVAQKYPADVLEEAQAELHAAHDLASSFERPGRYHADLGPEYGAKEQDKAWYGVSSSRNIVADQFPWYSEQSITPGTLADAATRGKGANYERIVDRIADHIQAQREEAKPVIEEFAPELERLSAQVRDIDPELAQTLLDIRSGRYASLRDLPAFIEGKVTDAQRAAQFSQAFDELAGAEAGNALPEVSPQSAESDRGSREAGRGEEAPRGQLARLEVPLDQLRLPEPEPINPAEVEDMSRMLGRRVTAEELPEIRRRLDAERNVTEGLRGNRRDDIGAIREEHRTQLERGEKQPSVEMPERGKEFGERITPDALDSGSWSLFGIENYSDLSESQKAAVTAALSKTSVGKSIATAESRAPIALEFNFPLAKDRSVALRRLSEDDNIAQISRNVGVRSVLVDSPHTFDLSQQGGVTPDGVVRLNPNAEDLQNTFLHELGEIAWGRSTPDERAQLRALARKIIPTLERHAPGYARLASEGTWNEAVAEMFGMYRDLPANVQASLRAFAPSRPFESVFPERQVQPREVSVGRNVAQRGVRSWDDVQKHNFGYLTQEDDLARMVRDQGDRMVVIKDVNGGRHLMPASVAARALEDPIVSGNVGSLFLAKDSEKLSPPQLDEHTLRYIPGLRESIQRATRDVKSKHVEVLPRPTVGEWLRDSAAGRPAGEVPQLRGPQNELERIQHFRGEIANAEDHLRELRAEGNYEEAAEVAENLRFDKAQLEEVMKGVHDVEPDRILPGMENAVREQREAAGREQGRQLTEHASRPPESNEETAGRLERESPLFRGTAASPQSEMFTPRESAARTTERDYEDVGKHLGIEYRGVMGADMGLGDKAVVIYQDPESKTSIGVKVGEWSPERLKEKLEEARARMAGDPTGGTVYSGLGFLDPQLIRRVMPDSIKNALSENISLGEREAGIVREKSGELARKKEQVFQQYADAMARWEKRPIQDGRDFILREQHGEKQPNAQDQAVANQLQKEFASRRAVIEDLKHGSFDHWREHYFPQFWERPNQVADWVKQRILGGRRPLQGPAGFRKARVFDDLQEGLDAGFKPLTNNPVSMALLKLHEMDRHVMAHQILGQSLQEGLAKFVAFGEAAPTGWTRVNDSMFRVMHFSKEAQGMVLRGEYYMPVDAAKILNNYLAPGLRGNPLYDVFRGAGNTLNQAQLGFSAFHAMFSALNSSISDFALALRKASRFSLLEAAQAGMRSASLVTSPVRHVVQGTKLMREYLSPGTYEKYSELADAVAKSGGRIYQDPFYRNTALTKFWKAWGEGDWKRVGLQAFPAALEKMAQPVMEKLVPRLKLGAFSDVAREALDRLPPGAGKPQIRAALDRAWDSIDNRFGQVVYDNLFINKAMKDLGLVSVRSLGWNLGTLRELGGAGKDLIKAAGRAATGERPRFTDRIAYTMALPIVTGYIGALVNYAYTGQGPQELKDYFYPRTGRTLPSGEPERISIPTYMKDVYAFAKHPVVTASHKIHPLLSMIADTVSNQDFYGTEIRHPDDPLVKQAGQLANYVADQFSPLSYRNLSQRARAEGRPGVKGALREAVSPAGLQSFVGITPAPSSVTHTAAEEKALEILNRRAPQGTRTSDEFTRGLQHSFLRGEVASGRMSPQDLAQRVRAGDLTAKEAGDILKQMREAPIVHYTRSLPIEDFLEVWDAANPREREQLRSLLLAKRHLVANLPANERAAVSERVNRAVEESARGRSSLFMRAAQSQAQVEAER